MEKETKVREEVKSMPRSLELHLLKMFFGIHLENTERFRPKGELERKVEYKRRRELVRDLLATTIPQKYSMDTSSFKVEVLDGEYWTNKDSIILPDKDELVKVLKENHKLSDKEITELLENYVRDEQLADIPIDY